ncbi:hypothetical protein ACJZ2D_004891 [Fusarium nematophilum]
MSRLLKEAFAQTRDIGEIVKDFDWSTLNPRDSESEVFLHTDLAPSYGNLNREALRDMHDNVKIMMVGAMKYLSKTSDKSWQSIYATLTQSELLQPYEYDVARADKLIKKSGSDFKFDSSPDAGLVNEVKRWFESLVSDDDVLRSTKIDIETLTQIVAAAGTTIESFETFSSKNERHEQALVDISALRFPDLDSPFFKLYRIKLDAWSDSSRIPVHQEDNNGISGEYKCRVFRPRDSVMDGLSVEARQKAISWADSLLDG